MPIKHIDNQYPSHGAAHLKFTGTTLFVNLNSLRGLSEQIVILGQLAKIIVLILIHIATDIVEILSLKSR